MSWDLHQTDGGWYGSEPREQAWLLHVWRWLQHGPALVCILHADQQLPPCTISQLLTMCTD